MKMNCNSYRTRIYRVVFLLAALYNLGFGLWSGFWPHSFFHLFGLEFPRYPSLWQCLGMVIGLYGLAYATAAFRLDIAKPLIGIGLLGKILGPIGWILTVDRGEWPIRTFTLIVFNDILWWLPFTLFLLEGIRFGDWVRACAPYVCAVLNALAAGALLLVLRPGSEATPDPKQRAAYIAEHPVLWRGGWGLWIAAALSLLAFYAWWGARLPESRWGVLAFLIGSFGISCDALAESLYIGWLPERLESVGPLGTLLTGAAANGFYTVAGIILTLETKSLRGMLLIWTWIVWASGLSLTVSTVIGNVPGMVASTAVLMSSFSPWVWVMGRRLR